MYFKRWPKGVTTRLARFTQSALPGARKLKHSIAAASTEQMHPIGGSMNFDLRAAAVGCLVMLAYSGLCSAQKIDRTQPPAVGDKSIYSWSLNNKVQNVEYEVTSVSDHALQAAQRVSGKEFSFVWDINGNYT